MQFRTPPPIEVIAYTAGIIDGEGYIGAPGADNFRVSVSQAEKNNGEQLCEWLRDQWKMGLILTVHRLTNLGIQSQMWVWQVGARRDVRYLLELTSPFLIIKRERAGDVVSLINSHIDDEQRWTNWTQAEDEYLTTNTLQPSKDIAAVLGRSHYAVKERRRKLGLSRPGGKGWRAHMSEINREDVP